LVHPANAPALESQKTWAPFAKYSKCYLGAT